MNNKSLSVILLSLFSTSSVIFGQVDSQTRLTAASGNFDALDQVAPHHVEPKAETTTTTEPTKTDNVDNGTIIQNKQDSGSETSQTENSQETQTKDNSSPSNSKAFYERAYEKMQGWKTKVKEMGGNAKTHVVEFVTKANKEFTEAHKANRYYLKYLDKGFCGAVMIGGVIYLVHETYGLQETKDFVFRNGKVVLASAMVTAASLAALGYYLGKDNIKSGWNTTLTFADKYRLPATGVMAALVIGTYIVKHTSLIKKIKSMFQDTHDFLDDNF